MSPLQPPVVPHHYLSYLVSFDIWWSRDTMSVVAEVSLLSYWFSNFTQIGVHPFPRLGDGGGGIGDGGVVVGYGGNGGGDGILLITLVDLVQ